MYLTSLIIQLQITGRKLIHTTAVDFLVAKTLNRYSDSTFIEVLSECDRTAMSELVGEFLCSGLDKEEQGKQLYIKIDFQNTVCYG